MNNPFESPWPILIGAILFIIGGTLMIAHAPELILFSGLFALAGKVILFLGVCISILAVFLIVT